MPFSIQFLGVGGAFALPTIPGDLTTCLMQSNMVITAENGKRMLFDCGTDIRFSAQMCGFGPGSFDAVYISHEHADHAGGLEWLLLNRLFSGGEKPILFTESGLMGRLWTQLQGGLVTTTMGIMNQFDYVRYHKIDYLLNSSEHGVPKIFEWESLKLCMTPQIHVQHEIYPMRSFGLVVQGEKQAFWISSDTIFNRSQIKVFADDVDTIFHDCEVGFKTGVHAHYDELLTLPDSVRAKMWLYHYNSVEADKKDAVADGFRGFVTRGQTFEFN